MKPDRPSDEAFYAAALELDCDEAAIRAVARVEAGLYGAFLDSGEPVILYEPHVFHDLTSGRWVGAVVTINGRHYNLSLERRDPTQYGPVSAQHRKLQAASQLNRSAALKSCSWGLFQIMGKNYELAGFYDLQPFVNAMYESADKHLAAFVAFIRNTGLRNALREHDWAMFARRYNGSDYRAHRYDKRIDEAYKELANV